MLGYIVWERVPRNVMANVPGCDIVVTKFERQLRHYINFQTNTLEKGMNSLIP